MLSSFKLSLDPLALPFFSKNPHYVNPIEQALHQLGLWNFSLGDQKLVFEILKDWYSSKSLNSVLSQWENNNNIVEDKSVKEPIKLLCYNVEGWGTRALEAIELVYKLEASICVFTEVGELWSILKYHILIRFIKEVLIIVEEYV
jgi:hypothetical protein